MYHRAAVIDTLRQGDLLSAGDALAARFIAIHQSMLDANWHTAKHMEIHSMDESMAASPAVVLASRRHSRMVLKAQGYPSYEQGYQRGRGKGSKSEWSNLYGKGDPKGKSRGGKNKGKSKGKAAQGDWQQNNSEWKDKKEKPAEKTG